MCVIQLHAVGLNEKADIHGVNLLIIDEKKELIPRQSLRIRGATRLESDLFTANDYALITRLVKKIIVNNLVIMTTDENISDFRLYYIRI